MQTQPRARKCMVCFPGGKKKSVSTDEMFSNSGSIPCPALHAGECVLVRVRARNLADSDIYMPAVVGAVPENPRSAAGLHTVTAFGGKMLICTRRAMVKLTRPKHKEVCDQLAIRLQATKESFTASTNDASLSGIARTKLTEQEKQHRGQLDASYTVTQQTGTVSPSPASHSPSPAPASSPKHTLVPLHTSSPVTSKHLRKSVEELDASHSLSMIRKDASFPPTPPHSPLPHPSTELIDRGTSPRPYLCDASTNTKPMMESKGVTTDPEKCDVSLATDNLTNSSRSHSHSHSPPSSLYTPDREKEGSEKSSQLSTRDLQCSSQEPPQLQNPLCNKGSIPHHSSFPPNNLLYNSMALASLSSNMQVLARWLDDGWFYRSKFLMSVVLYVGTRLLSVLQ